MGLRSNISIQISSTFCKASSHNYPAFSLSKSSIASGAKSLGKMRQRIRPGLPEKDSSPTISPIRRSKQETIEISAKSQNPQNPQIFHPDLFEGLVVELYFDDSKELETARRNIEVFGATVMQDGDTTVPDVIVTKSSPLRRNLAIELARSKYMGKIKNGRVPKVVIDIQIPWIFWPTKKLETIREARNVKVVVADSSEKHRPAFKIISEPIILHLDPVPAGYVVSPFIPVEETDKRVSSAVSSARAPDIPFTASPPDHGFCELCKVTFANAEEHHASKEHLSKISEPGRWAPLDALISHITALHRL